MEFKVTTKQGTTYNVNDDDVWLWICLERDMGLTFGQAREKIIAESLDVMTYILHHAALSAGHTQLKTQKAWVQHEFEEFEVIDADPKASDDSDKIS